MKRSIIINSVKPPAEFAKQIKLQNEQLKTNLFPNLKTNLSIYTDVLDQNKLVEDVSANEELASTLPYSNTVYLAEKLDDFARHHELSDTCMTDLTLILSDIFPELPTIYDEVKKKDIFSENTDEKLKILLSEIKSLKASVDQKVRYAERLVTDFTNTNVGKNNESYTSMKYINK